MLVFCHFAEDLRAAYKLLGQGPNFSRMKILCDHLTKLLHFLIINGLTELEIAFDAILWSQYLLGVAFGGNTLQNYLMHGVLDTFGLNAVSFSNILNAIFLF